MDKIRSDLILPVSAIVATKDRSGILKRTVHSLAGQSHLPSELIIVDASGDEETRKLCALQLGELNFGVLYVKADVAGAASQRVLGLKHASESVVWFLDDDVILEDGVVERLWGGIGQQGVGAVNAMISNQRYTKPGRVTRMMYWLMYGSHLSTYAGKIIGPAWNLLPEDEPGLPDYVECEWLNTTCTMYRREVMPDPIFPKTFEGYSLMEDVALSVTIGRKYKLLNARTARIFHDSQSGAHKNNVRRVTCMQLVNRHYIMSRVLNHKSLSAYLKLVVFELFGLSSCLYNRKEWKNFFPVLVGKLQAIYIIALK